MGLFANPPLARNTVTVSIMERKKKKKISLSIPKDKLAELPVVTYPGHLVLVTTTEHAAAALAEIRKCPVVGFDTETRPSFRKGHANKVALIQVSTGDVCYLFRINKFGFTNEMREFFEDPGVLKIGLSLKDDFHVMHRGHEFTPAGFIDLQDVVPGYGIIDASLQKIYGILYGERISKSQRLSNWEATALTTAQQLYAAIDAWASLRIYHTLTSGEFDPAKSPYKVEPKPEVPVVKE